MHWYAKEKQVFLAAYFFLPFIFFTSFFPALFLLAFFPEFYATLIVIELPSLFQYIFNQYIIGEVKTPKSTLRSFIPYANNKYGILRAYVNVYIL